jgi:hypothetical protein
MVKWKGKCCLCGRRLKLAKYLTETGKRRVFRRSEPLQVWMESHSLLQANPAVYEGGRGHFARELNHWATARSGWRLCRWIAAA